VGCFDSKINVREQCQPCQVRHLLRRHHGHERHAVHVIRDGLGFVHAVVDPARARRRLERLRQVEEVNRASRRGWF
jgi:hypothetical protein